MQKYFCNPCGYTYDPEKGDPEHGIAPGTAFEDLPDDWCCPLCGVNKSMFQPCINNYNSTFDKLYFRKIESGCIFTFALFTCTEPHRRICC